MIPATPEYLGVLNGCISEFTEKVSLSIDEMSEGEIACIHLNEETIDNLRYYLLALTSQINSQIAEVSSAKYDVLLQGKIEKYESAQKTTT